MFSFTRKLGLFSLLLVAATAFGVDCNTTGFNCTNLDTQIKGSRLPSWGVDSGSANAYAITTIAPLGPSLRTGSSFAFIATHANTTASTLVVDGGSTIAIKKNVSTALASGDIPLNAIVLVTYDGTNFQCTDCGLANFALATASITINGQTCTLSGSCNVNSGDATHSVALNEGNGNALGALALGAHQLPVGAASADPSAKTLPDCTDTGGNHLNFTQSTDAFSCGTTSSSGGGSGAEVQISTQTATSGSTSELDFPSVFSSSYHVYHVRIYALTPATNNTVVQFQFTTNNGSTYDTAGNYYWSITLVTTGTTTVGNAGTVADTSFTLFTDTNGVHGLTNSVSPALEMEFIISDPQNASARKNLHGQGHAVTSVPTTWGYGFYGTDVNTAATTGFRIKMSSGTFGAVITVYGITP